jgi:hypothetical protein
MMSIVGWKTVYMNSPRKIVGLQGIQWRDAKDLVWGGEATLWSEQVSRTPTSIE